MNRILFAMLLVTSPAMAAPSATSKSCIANRDIREKQATAETGYYVRTPNGWWRNTVSCPAFASDRALVTRSNNDQQCSGDIVEAFDAFSRINYGSCGLGKWEKVDSPPAQAAK